MWQEQNTGQNGRNQMGFFTAFMAFFSIWGLGQGQNAGSGRSSDHNDQREAEPEYNEMSNLAERQLGSDTVDTASEAELDDSYTIDVIFDDDVPEALRESVLRAQETLENLITGDVAGTDTIDDLQVRIQMAAIDGQGASVARTLVNEFGADDLPVDVDIFVDEDDIAALAERGDLDSLVLHEMLHAVGFGVSWERLGLIGEDSEGNPVFTGAHATAAYAEMTGAADDPAGVPLEQHGSGFTAQRHWDEERIDGELMIGYLTGQTSVSDLTQASLIDIGHEIADDEEDQWDARINELADLVF